MALLEIAGGIFCFFGFLVCVFWLLVAPPHPKKKRAVDPKLDLIRNRFTTSKIPSNIDVIVVGSGK